MLNKTTGTNPNPDVNRIIIPVKKTRFLNKTKSIKGFFRLFSVIIKKVMPIMDKANNPTDFHKLESIFQSANTISRTEVPAKKPPIQSMSLLAFSSLDSWTILIVIIRITADNTTASTNTDLHPKIAIKDPLIRGPTIKPNAAIAPHIPMAKPRSLC